jgi:hypothetical protein
MAVAQKKNKMASLLFMKALSVMVARLLRLLACDTSVLSALISISARLVKLKVFMLLIILSSNFAVLVAVASVCVMVLVACVTVSALACVPNLVKASVAALSQE